MPAAFDGAEKDGVSAVAESVDTSVVDGADLTLTRLSMLLVTRTNVVVEDRKSADGCTMLCHHPL